ncbi:MAG: hypothetical protein FH749_00225 [Firmicutes bacterium]|nr:hypothetical protein [Bacillota bacterium]
MDTPKLIVDREKLQHNIEAMQDFARQQGINLRPHIKAHKTAEIARLQVEAGANGITVAKLGEAEGMLAEGFNDILVAYPLIGAEKIERVRALLDSGCHLTLMIDSRAGATALNDLRWPDGIDVLVKVNTGLNRCGLEPGPKLVDFVSWVHGLSNLRFRGIMTHAGHAYGAKSWGEVQEIALSEGEQMVAAAAEIRDRGIPVEVVSVGATPTVMVAGAVPGVTEIRPGNYVFYDATQVMLGVVKPERCSLKVVTTVVSRPAPDRAIVDAGAKTLALDRGAHGSSGLSGHGLLSDPGWRLTRLSEEHGVIEGDNLPAAGSVIEIIPNHACPVVNLADRLELSTGAQWPVTVRGRTS